MTGKMTGIVKEAAGPGAQLRRDLPIPQITKTQVLMKVRTAAVCGTDVHIYHWGEYAARRMKKLPMVFGHEAAGEIVEIGAEVQGLSVGQRISVETHIPCNACPACRAGRRHLCQGGRLFGVTEPGAFAQYAAVEQSVAVPLPEEISYDMGAMLEAMGAGVHGVETAQVRGKRVLLCGCGPIGLMAAGACRAHGAAQIIACDVYDEKLALARKMGAECVVNSRREDLSQAVLALTGGEGADAAIDITGSAAAITAALRSLRCGGMMVSVGLPDGAVPLHLAEDIIYREILYTGISGRLLFETWDDCMRILRTPGFSLSPVMGGVYPLEQFETALSDMAKGAPGKMLLHPWA